MRETQTVQPASPSLELRVLEGDLAGASAPLHSDRPVIVGSAPDHDIVLRSADPGDCCVSLSLHPEGLCVRVLRGTVQAGGERLACDTDFIVPLYTPLHLGDNVVAVGETDSPHWDQPPPDPAARDEALSIDPPSPQPSRDALPLPHDSSRWLPWAGAVVSVISVGVFVFAHAVLPDPPTAQQQAGRAEQALRAAGFAQLAVRADDAGVIQVSGSVDTAAQRAKVEQIMAAEGLASRIDAAVRGDMAAAVVEVFRLCGVTAEAATTGPGSVVVDTREADLALLAQIETTARRDVPGLSMLQLRNTPPAARVEPVPVIDDPGKRVASIVPSDSPYVVTVDGTRYFEGALLPTGHRITAIREREVLLERSGTTTPMQF